MMGQELADEPRDGVTSVRSLRHAALEVTKPLKLFVPPVG
jgi:hypothetical protein